MITFYTFSLVSPTYPARHCSRNWMTMTAACLQQQDQFWLICCRAVQQVSDLKREISLKYNVLSEDGVALRGLFLIDREVKFLFSLWNTCRKEVKHDDTLQQGRRHAAQSVPHRPRGGISCHACEQKPD